MSNLRRIRFSNGRWWLVDQEADRSIQLDPEIERCAWNVGILCKNLGIGCRTFSRLMEESLGITGKRWLRELRIVRACHLLREDCKIEGVARTLRFKHLPDFTLEFRKLLGVSPSEYMRRERSRSAGSISPALLWIQAPDFDFIMSIFPNHFF